MPSDCIWDVAHEAQDVLNEIERVKHADLTEDEKRCMFEYRQATERFLKGVGVWFRRGTRARAPPASGSGRMTAPVSSVMRG